MFQKVEVHNWVIDVDIDATKTQYSHNWGLCHCLDCLNFYEYMKSFSNLESKFLNSLGITPSKCVHLSEFGPNENGLHLYSGCYHIVGKIRKGEPVNTDTWNDENVGKIGHFTFVFLNDLQFVPGGFTKPTLQIDFEMEIPWVIQES
ncbi:hypothetical protein M4D55_15645 [Metabacillus idriensis]|uniref:hypothetical protein n=1 Tax=Metabacillus idriensis TaxID=324768 RepID=UPI0020422483|nr:hypothetical protein [Metabacillus idriensis]MCM3597208.1 hypothetical protein [Metabacillus idriensis]